MGQSGTKVDGAIEWIVEGIKSGKFIDTEFKDALLSEAKLASMATGDRSYGRSIIRQALADMESQGYLSRGHGRRTLIHKERLERLEQKNSLLSFTVQAKNAKAGFSVCSEVLDYKPYKMADLIKGDFENSNGVVEKSTEEEREAYKNAQKILGLHTKDKRDATVWRIKRQRILKGGGLDDKTVVAVHEVLSLGDFGGIPRARLQGSLYEVYTKVLYRTPVFAEEQIEVVVVDKRDERRLTELKKVVIELELAKEVDGDLTKDGLIDLIRKNPLIIRTRTTHDSSGPIDWMVGYERGRHFKYDYVLRADVTGIKKTRF